MTTVGVAAAIFDSLGRILCVKQNYRDKLWALPGGGVERGESPVRALQREVQEESGFIVQVDELVGVYATPWKDALFLCFCARIIGDEQWHADGEIAERAFFGRDELPAPMSFRMTQRILDAFAGKRGIVHVFDPD